MSSNHNKKLKNVITDELLVSQLRTLFAKDLAENPNINTHWSLCRFIRARNYNMKDVEKMLTNYFNWRKKVDMKKIMDMDPEKIKAITDIHERGFYGVDNEGRPVTIDRFLLSDVKRILSSEFDGVREPYMIALHERIINIVFPLASKAANKRIDSLVVIYDLKGINFSKIFDSNFKAFVKFLINIVQDNYPQILGKMFLVNVSLAFRGIWAIIRLWMDKKTLSKFELHGGVPTERLAEFINIDSLPDFLGGNCKEPLKAEKGPWQPTYSLSIENRTFFLKDRTPEYEYFYTDDERQRLKSHCSNMDNIVEHEGIHELFKVRTFETTIKNMK